MKRSEAKEIIENNGGIVLHLLVKKQIIYYVEKMLDLKKKAEDLKIKIINETELKDLLNE